jgi:hypothetical protein
MTPLGERGYSPTVTTQPGPPPTSHTAVVTPAMTPLAEQEAQAKEIRRQAFAVFVASMRDEAARLSWAVICDGIADSFTESGSREVQDFKDGWGWPDTLRAIADAMQADDTARREAFERR